MPKVQAKKSPAVPPKPERLPKMTFDRDVFDLFGVDWKQHKEMCSDLCAIACRMSEADRHKLLKILTELGRLAWNDHG